MWTHFNTEKGDTFSSRQKNIVRIRQHEMVSDRRKGQAKPATLPAFFLKVVIVFLRYCPEFFWAGFEESPFSCVKFRLSSLYTIYKKSVLTIGYYSTRERGMT